MKDRDNAVLAEGKREAMRENEKAAESVTRRDFIKKSLVGAAGVAAAAFRGPAVLRAQAKPIKLALLGICSGPFSMAGEGCLRGAQFWAEDVNRKGGLLGRKVEVIQRDTFGKPEEAARYARDFAAGQDTVFIFAHGASPEAFAVAAIAKELKKVIFTGTETMEFTADPKVRSRYCFRATRNCLLDMIDGGRFAANKSKELGLTRWYTIAPDFAFGRGEVAIFLEHLKRFHPKAEIVGQAWPKPEEPDYTAHITAMTGAKPDAIFCGLFAGDGVGFVKQASMYGLLDKTKFLGIDLTEPQVIDPIKKGLGKFPAGLYAGIKATRAFPNTELNRHFNDSFLKRFGSPLVSYTLSTYLGSVFLEEAVKKEGSTETEAVVSALEDLSVKAPWGVGPNGTVTLRGRDHTLINYAMGWGRTTSEEPYMSDFVPANWSEVLAEETEWLKRKGWL